MQSYHVVLNFKIAFDKCDPTPGQKPPGTPEEMADLSPELLLVCEYEEPDALKTRTYRSEMRILAVNDDTASRTLISIFKHLPHFEVRRVRAEPVISPPATAEYVVICRFRSVAAFFRLNNAFHAHFAEDGLFFNAPGKPGYYVAYVVIQAPMSDGLEKTVEALLRDTFDAATSETAEKFAEVTTNLL
jgi:hypothetical protein